MATRKNRTSKVSRRRKNRTQRGGGIFDGMFSRLKNALTFGKPKTPDGSPPPVTPDASTKPPVTPPEEPAQPTPGGSKGGKRGCRNK